MRLFLLSQTWTSLKSAQHTSATPRCLRADARGRRAGGASSWRIGDPARATCSYCADPGPVLRSSLERGGGSNTEECRCAAGFVTRSKRAPSASALSRVGEAAGRRRLADSSTCSLAVARRSSSRAGCATRRASHPGPGRAPSARARANTLEQALLSPSPLLLHACRPLPARCCVERRLLFCRRSSLQVPGACGPGHAPV